MVIIFVIMRRKMRMFFILRRSEQFVYHSDWYKFHPHLRHSLTLCSEGRYNFSILIILQIGE